MNRIQLRTFIEKLPLENVQWISYQSEPSARNSQPEFNAPCWYYIILAKHPPSAGFPSPSEGAVTIWGRKKIGRHGCPIFGCLWRPKFRVPPAPQFSGASGAPNGFKNLTRAMMIPNMCLVLKLDNGKVVSIANEQNHRITDRVTEPSSSVLVYRYICIYNKTISYLRPPISGLIQPLYANKLEMQLNKM